MGSSESRTVLQHSLTRLLSEEVAPGDLNFWQVLFSVKLSGYEFWNTISYDDLHKLQQEQPQNFTVLIDKCLNALENKEEVAVSFLNRIVPTCLNSTEIWWGEDRRAIRLVRSCLELCNSPGYALPKKTSVTSTEEAVAPDLLWYRGVFRNTSNAKTNQAINKRRVGLLSLILVCMSEPVYKAIDHSEFSVWQWTFSILPGSRQLLANVMNCLNAYDSVGKWNLPYTGYLSTDEEQNITKTALQILTMLIGYRAPSEELAESFPEAKEALASVVEPEKLFANPLGDFFQSIGEISVFIQSLARKLEVLSISDDTYFPKSQRPLTCPNELIIVLWKCMDLSSNFTDTLLQTTHPKQVLLPILIYMYQNLDKPTMKALIFLSANILNKLSLQRQFGFSLNLPFQESFTYLLPKLPETYGELLILAVSDLLLTKAEHIQLPVCCNLVMIFCNTFHFLKRCGLQASQQLLSILFSASKPEFLFANEYNFVILSYILEALSNLIEYQWETAADIVYFLTNYKQIFENILKYRSDEGQICEPTTILYTHLLRQENVDPAYLEQIQACKNKIPLTTFQTVVREIYPLIEKNKQIKDIEEIKDEIRKTNTVGLIQPSPLSLKRLEITRDEQKWILGSIWATFYVSESSVLFDSSKIELFILSNQS